jgi:hypothetical protein
MYKRKIKESHFYEKKTEDNSDSEQSDVETNATTYTNSSISPKLLEDISFILKSIIKKKKTNFLKESEKIFYHPKVPEISIYDYLYRIKKYSSIEDSTLIISLIYIDRVCKNKGIVLTKYNIYRILFSAIFTALKFNEDIFYKTSFYAKIGGISIKELINLENAFIKLIDFKLFVSEEIFQTYSGYLKSNNKRNNN